MTFGSTSAVLASWYKSTKTKCAKIHPLTFHLPWWQLPFRRRGRPCRRNSIEWWGTACSTNIWISSHHSNEYLCAGWGWVAYSPSQTHTGKQMHTHTHTRTHRPQVSLSSASALNLASHMSSPGLLQRTQTSYLDTYTHNHMHATE